MLFFFFFLSCLIHWSKLFNNLLSVHIFCLRSSLCVPGSAATFDYGPTCLKNLLLVALSLLYNLVLIKAIGKKKKEVLKSDYLIFVFVWGGSILIFRIQVTTVFFLIYIIFELWLQYPNGIVSCCLKNFTWSDFINFC